MTPEPPEGLVTLSHPRSPVSEAYRSLRTNLEFTSLEQPLTTMLVTSSSSEEGKSTTLANLAVTLAQADKEVIVADCDLRRPSQHEIFGAPMEPGVTSLLLDEAPLADPPLQDTSVPRLKLLPSGPLPPNPAELLGSQKMEEVIRSLAGQADMVLFDAPPVIVVTDAAVLAAKLDGVLLVIRAGSTKRDHAERAVALLQKVNARVVGSVLTNAALDTTVGPYYATPT